MKSVTGVRSRRVVSILSGIAPPVVSLGPTVERHVAVGPWPPRGQVGRVPTAGAARRRCVASRDAGHAQSRRGHASNPGIEASVGAGSKEPLLHQDAHFRPMLVQA